jgi:hypothetical protein
MVDRRETKGERKMKKLTMMVTLGVAMAVGMASEASADTYVRGYCKSNGTYVQPHYRSSPDGSAWNNWSTQGNINPYTGSFGTQNPWSYTTPRAFGGASTLPYYGGGSFGTMPCPSEGTASSYRYFYGNLGR